MSNFRQIKDASEKLQAFMKALEISKLDDFLKRAQTKDYETLGKEMAKRIKLSVSKAMVLEEFHNKLENE